MKTRVEAGGGSAVLTNCGDTEPTGIVSSLSPAHSYMISAEARSHRREWLEERYVFIPVWEVLRTAFPFITPRETKIAVKIIEDLIRNHIYTAPFIGGEQKVPYARGSFLHFWLYDAPTEEPLQRIPAYWGLPFLARKMLGHLPTTTSNAVATLIEKLAFGPDIDLVALRNPNSRPIEYQFKPAVGAETSKIDILTTAFSDEFLRQFTGVRTYRTGADGISSQSLVNSSALNVNGNVMYRNTGNGREEFEEPLLRIDLILRTLIDGGWRLDPNEIRDSSYFGLRLDQESIVYFEIIDGNLCLRLPKDKRSLPKKIELYFQGRKYKNRWEYVGRTAYFMVRGFAQLAAYGIYPENVDEIARQVSRMYWDHGEVLSQGQRRVLPDYIHYYPTAQEKARIQPLLHIELILGAIFGGDSFETFMKATRLERGLRVHTVPDGWQQLMNSVCAIQEAIGIFGWNMEEGVEAVQEKQNYTEAPSPKISTHPKLTADEVQRLVLHFETIVQLLQVEEDNWQFANAV